MDGVFLSAEDASPRGGEEVSSRYVRYDKWGFSIAWCKQGENEWYWHVRHPAYGFRRGHAVNRRDAHERTNWAIGDLRQGISEKSP